MEKHLLTLGIFIGHVLTHSPEDSKPLLSRVFIKYKMQALACCAWINVRRLLLFDLEMALQRA